MVLTQAGKALEQAERFWLEGDIENAKVSLESSRLLYRKNKDKIGEAAAITQLGDIERHEDNIELSLGLYNKAKDLLLNSNESDHRKLAAVYLRTGELYIETNDHKNAIEQLNMACDIFDRIDNRIGIARVKGMLAKNAYKEKKEDLALDYYKEAREIYKEEANTQHEAGTLVKIAEIYLNIGDKASTNIFHEKALDLYKETGDILGSARSRLTLGVLMLKSGDVINAREILKKSADEYNKAGDFAHEAEALLELARADASPENGDLERAKSHYKKAIDKMNLSELAEMKELALKEYEELNC